MTFLDFAHVVFVAFQLDLRIAVGSGVKVLALQLGQFLHGELMDVSASMVPSLNDAVTHSV